MKLQAIHRNAIVCIAVSLLLGGCANRKVSYRAPVAPQLGDAGKWATTPAGGASAEPADDAAISRWWSTLGDPILTSLEDRAVKSNLDLRKAEAKIRQARANRESARSDLQPSLSANGSIAGNRTSTRSRGNLGQSYSAALDASWEPDFFQRIRGSVSAYEADVESAQEDLRNTMVTLTADVALNYTDVRSYQAQLAVTNANLAKYEETYELALAKFEAGLSTELDVQQALQTVQSTRAGIPSLETSIQKAANAIAVLLGERPGAINAELAEVKPVPVIPAAVAVGIPADLVRRRPDIRGAERQIAAQTARVGVAQANLYPALTLSGTFNFSAKDVLNLLTPATLASSVAGSVQQTIFNRQKLRQQVNIQNIVLEQYELSYESTVLNAIEDVENALQAFGAEQIRRQSLVEAVRTAGNAADMSSELYRLGLKDFLTVLDSERSVLNLQDSLAQSDATITANLIRLYKAMGGGWN
jgi:NodT family efflux transporter outer membrane factor (OMF) lipoprotein